MNSGVKSNAGQGHKENLGGLCSTADRKCQDGWNGYLLEVADDKDLKRSA